MNMLTRSEHIGQLAKALALAQAEMTNPGKGADNPFFHAKFAPLDVIVEACRPQLSKHGIAFMQPAKRDGSDVVVETILMHESGEWLSSELSMTPGYTAKDGTFVEEKDPQAIGSAISYCRRYSLQSMVGIAPANEDDDGNGASGRDRRPQNPQQPAEPPQSITPAKFTGWRDIRVHMPKSKSAGKKLGYLESSAIEMLKVHWADKLDMTTAHQIDKILKAAVYEGYAELFPDTGKPFPADLIATLRQKCADAVITEETFLKYAKDTGLIGVECLTFEDVNVGDEDLERFAKNFDALMAQWGFANPEPKGKGKKK